MLAAFEFADLKRATEQAKLISTDKVWPTGTYLFTRVLPVSRIGTYHVTLSNRQGGALAKADIEGTREFFHSWMPWLEEHEKYQSPAAGIARPLEDYESVPREILPPETSKKGHLPTFWPAETEQNMTIRWEAGSLVIRSDKQFTTSRPERHFLARWWVNDKSFQPQQVKEFTLFEGYGLVSDGKESRVTIDFHPERLNAKPGDKVSLQLLYCEDGWTWCTDDNWVQAHAFRITEGPKVRLSNRIELPAR